MGIELTARLNEENIHLILEMIDFDVITQHKRKPTESPVADDPVGREKRPGRVFA